MFPVEIQFEHNLKPILTLVWSQSQTPLKAIWTQSETIESSTGCSVQFYVGHFWVWNRSETLWSDQSGHPDWNPGKQHLIRWRVAARVLDCLLPWPESYLGSKPSMLLGRLLWFWALVGFQSKSGLKYGCRRDNSAKMNGYMQKSPTSVTSWVLPLYMCFTSPLYTRYVLPTLECQGQEEEKPSCLSPQNADDRESVKSMFNKKPVWNQSEAVSRGRIQKSNSNS